jgi:tripartite-type tricarboxylate transporter receptor subunit TctC
MVTDLLGGQVQVAFDQLATALPHIRQGKVRALAVAWDKRLPQLPDVPTFAELALFGNNDSSWFGLVAPAKTRQGDVPAINAALRRVLRSGELQAKLEPLGVHAR